MTFQQEGRHARRNRMELKSDEDGKIIITGKGDDEMSLNWLEEKLPLTTTIDGSSIDLQLYQLVAEKPGPHLYLQSGVHGAELQGHLVLIELLKSLPHLLNAGSVSCIPFANPLGLNNKSGEFTPGRYDPVSRENWNRNYLELPSKPIEELWNWDEIIQKVNAPEDGWQDRYREICQRFLVEKLEFDRQNFNLSLARKLAYTLQLEAIPADYVLDLHTGPRATRYLYTSECMLEKSKDLGFPYSIVIPHEFDGAMDEAVLMPWIHLQKQLAKKGIEIEVPVESYTLELGDEEVVSRPDAVEDLSRIFHFMMKRSMIDQDVFEGWFKESFGESFPGYDHAALFAASLKSFRTYRCPLSGLVEYLVQPGEKVVEGQALFRVFEAKRPMDRDQFTVCSLNEGHVINVCMSSAVREGMRLVDVLETDTH